MNPDRKRQASFAVAAILLALAAGEVLFRLVFPLPEVANFNRVDYSELRRGVRDQPPLMNASIRWTSEPDGASYVHSLNLYGFRDETTWRVRPYPRRHRVMFFGDSFVEGMMAGDRETIPSVFEREGKYGHWHKEDAPPVEAMNLGMGGTGLVHYLRLAAAAIPLFRPRHVVLILYANDLPAPPHDPPGLLPSFHPVRFKQWIPRAAHVVRRAAKGRPVPRRWHTAPFSFFGAVPDPTNPLSDRAPGYEPFIEPGLLAAMKRGTLNPYLSDHVARSAEALRQPVDVRPHLEAWKALAGRERASLRVVYLPHSLQVSDYYMALARRYAVEKSATSLTGTEYQQHATSLAETCRGLGVPFLDLTPALRREEEAGRHLYWDYDNHMRPAGYAFVANALAEWR